METLNPTVRRTFPAGYVVAMGLSVAISVWGFRLWRQELSTPLCYHQDGLWASAMIKGVIEGEWFLTNERLGAPGAMEFADFPHCDTFHFFIIKLIGLIVPHFGKVLNIYYFATFPLTTLSSLFVLRRFNVSFLPAIVGSLLYTFLPYHMFRGEHHIFLAAYYLVPLIVMICLWVFIGDPVPFFSSQAGEGRLCFNRAGLGSVLVCSLVSSTGVYYAFFSCFLLLTSGLCGAFYRRRLYPLVSTAILIGILALGVFLNVCPYLFYTFSHGPNPEAFESQRSIGQAEEFGLKFIQLVLPHREHRVEFLRHITEKYCRVAPLVNENDTASLGLVGTLGFLLLIGRLFYRNPENDGPTLSHGLSLLNVTAVGLGTVGGVGSLLSLLVTANIRAYNRISVFVAFLSFMMVSLLLARIQRHWAGTRRSRPVVFGAFGLLLLVGILDQTSYRFGFEENTNQCAYESDAAFGRAIESCVPEGGMIFQLPYARFPESGTISQMSDYEHFRGYLHSRTLRWSYGAMRGRQGDAWQRSVAASTVPAMVETLAVAGFSGIYINRSGFDDHGADLERQLGSLLPDPGITSRDGNVLFISLRGYTQRMRGSTRDGR